MSHEDAGCLLSDEENGRDDSRVAGEIKRLLERGEHEMACQRFEQLVARHQRRANRVAYHYLRDPAEVDEAVQDAFVKAFVHLPTFREEFLFELWFTKIVVNGCLDRIKARNRRGRWLLPNGSDEFDRMERRPSNAPSPETSLLVAERGERLRAAVEQLPERQRTVVVLSQFEGYSTKDVGAMLGLTDTTVRVHLFRAIRALRRQLNNAPWLNTEAVRGPRTSVVEGAERVS